jgi:hypothetical protein
VNTDDSDMRTLLRRTAADVESPPGFLADVRRSGRRRLARRRLLTGAGLAVAATATGGAVLRSGGGGNVDTDVADSATPFFGLPTRGDLAADRSFLDSVRRVWSARMRGADLPGRGVPHVVWAGSTPAGPAAFVIQRTHDTNPDPRQRCAAYMGFLRPTSRGLEVMGFQGLVAVDDPSYEYDEAALIGADRDVLVVLDRGRPVEFSPELSYAADGRCVRTFRRVEFDDGAAVLPIPPQRTKITVALRRLDVRDRGVSISGTSEVLFPGGRDRAQTPPHHTHTLPGAERVWGGDPQGTVTALAFKSGALTEYTDLGGLHTAGREPGLTLYGATADGRLLFVTTFQFDDDPARAVALLARRDAEFAVVAGGFVTWSDPLPMRLRLPDGQGTVVAAEGAALSYRSGPADGWRDAGRDAALLPLAATQVRVTPKSGAAVEVSL